MKKIISVILIVFLAVALVLFVGPKDKVEPKTYTYYEYFDTLINVTIYDDMNEDYREDIEKIIKRVHDLTNNFEGGLIDSLNKNLSIDYNDELANIITVANEVYQHNGQYNIALGNVIDVWKSHMSECLENDKCSVPSDEELNFDKALIDPNNITISDKISIIEGLKVDLGGIAKGYLVDELNNYLRSVGFKHFIIDAGGNIYATSKPDDSPFLIGIVNPDNTGDNFMILSVKDKSVVTSGNYERFYEVDGKRYHHLINSDTLQPSNYFKSVTIISDLSIYGDAYSTMFFNTSYDEGKEILTKLDDIEVVWYDVDGNIYKSNGVEEYEEK